MNKTMLSKIMKKAWEIKKQHRDNIFSLCLKMAWVESKITVESIMKKLEEKADNVGANGWYAKAVANTWEKGSMSRVYFSIKEYRNGALRSEISYGYYDNVSKQYVTDCTLRGVKQRNAFN